MLGGEPASLRGVHVVFFNWRDTANPEGGGSERYVEAMARGLVAHGARATVFCAAHDLAPPDEVVDGVRFVRRGSRTGVYGEALRHLLLRRLGRVDVVVDVQNGMPFFSRLGTRKPVIVLVHHVHREQWPVVFPGALGTIGWWIESRLAPLLYRGSQYIVVSQATRNELRSLGVRGSRIAVVHNGTDPAPHTRGVRSPHPTVCVVGRLVPHKQVEHAVDAVAALRGRWPGIRLRVVGSGWWETHLAKYVAEVGAADVVTFEGQVSERRKHEIYAASWVQALPSLKEGWGLVVGEAGMHGVPTVAYAHAGGTTESIADGRSGVLVLDKEGLVDALSGLLADREERDRLGEGALEMSSAFGWASSQASFVRVIERVRAGQRSSAVDPLSDPS